MSRTSTAELLTLHAVRIQGFADAPAIARRFELDPDQVEEHLLDAQAHGWVTHAAFAGTQGWSLTERGRAENERRLATELEPPDSEVVRETYRHFLPLNASLLRACTDWQLKPTPDGRLMPNDHADPSWDAHVIHVLTGLGQALAPLIDRLTDVLVRFGGYDTRFTTALARVRDGDGAWVDRTDIDSCHRVWFELHEDLIATLGIDRRTEN